MAAQLSYDDENERLQFSNSSVTPDYVCFARLPFFSASAKHKPAVSPMLASAWAEVILQYWHACIANGDTDKNKPFYLFDMAPQDGQLAWLLLSELQERLYASELNIQFCYLSCYSDISSAENAVIHPYFKNYFSSGRYGVAHWNEANGTLHLQHQNVMLKQCDNPLVIVGLGYFQTLASELVGIHKGKVLQAHAAITQVDGDLGHYEFDYQWKTDPTPLAVQADKLIELYRQDCNGSTFTLPVQACCSLDALDKFAGGRTLLLAADAGVTSTKQIRLGALCPPAKWCKQSPAPRVNFHGISHHQRQQGAYVWQQQLDDNGMVLHMAWRDDKYPVSSQTLNDVIIKLADAHPDDIYQLVTVPHTAIDPLLFLRLSHYDPQLLKPHIVTLLEQPLTLTDAARSSWHRALIRVWRNYLPAKDYDSFSHQLGLLAANLGHFGLAKECFQLGLSYYGDDATDLYLLAWCEAASGGTELAMELLTRALVMEPEHSSCLLLYADLQKRLDYWHQHEWYSPPSSQSVDINPLRLEPLGDEHALSLLHQYRDPQISIMTRLPELAALDNVQIWIAEQQQEKSRACFAIMHKCWGFVGVVCAHCAGNAGYFYFWIGCDFQQQGLGQQAAHLLFDLLAQGGVTEIFTSAYEDNVRSMHALFRLGFEQLPFQAQSPDQELIFFHRSPQEQNSDHLARDLASRTALCELCNAIQHPVVFR